VILPDANLLLYAHNRDSPFHAKSSAWWARCLSGNEPVVLCAPVLFGFLRIATSGRAFSRPLTVQQAAATMTEWLEQPVVQFADMELKDVESALVLLLELGVGGNLSTDAQIAALSLRLGGVVHTADADYAHFPEVRWFNPLTARPRK
jgi:toxin-antitoxin system PIN domain toxin